MSIKADPTEFAGKRVLVSGGTKGLGRATVSAFLPAEPVSPRPPARSRIPSTASNMSRRT